MTPINYITKFFALIIFSATVLIAAASSADAAKGNKNRQPKQTKLWQQIDESRVPMRGGRSVSPEKYLVFRLNQPSLNNSLADLPLRNSDAARANPLVLEIPMPDGSIQRFRMEETQVLSPSLAAAFPDWKNFIGYGVDDPQSIGQFDWNGLGFHGYIENPAKGIVFIDPYQYNDRENYLVYYKHEFGRRSGDDFSCRLDDQARRIVDTDYKPLALLAPEFSLGTQIRRFRLAIATTGEYARKAANYDATNNQLTPRQIREAALAVITTTVGRLNGIYRRELASEFILADQPINDPNNPENANAKNIIFDNPATDPYDNTSEGPQLAINHTQITNRVGTANFDIGHLYGTGGGGVAAAKSLCDNDIKGQGYSARGSFGAASDPFVVDYVAHEIGHQFGGDHTYNVLDRTVDGDPDSGVCTTRAPLEAFEVGSGSTIMSYVGICANGRNLQQFNDFTLPSFHISSLTVIDTNIRTGDPQTTMCGTLLPGTNSVPTANAGASFTIPPLTPFTLTATGADTDAGDVANLLYSWEEYDLAPTSPTPTPQPTVSPSPSPTPFAPITGASGAGANPVGVYDIDNDNVLRPLLRAYSPVASPSRTFPSLTFILNPQNNDATADVNGVSGNQPVLTYQTTHPTNAPGAVCEPSKTCAVGERLPTVNRTMNFRVSVRDRRGGVVDAGTTLMVAAGAGPFQVTTQNASPVSWQGGTMQTVTWDVANTNAAPISAATVNILLSTDGGQTFPVTILANTPNDGTEQITVPNNPTTTARIKIEPVGNIFFDISNVNFTITAAAVTITVNPATLPNGTTGTAYSQTITATGGTAPYGFAVTAGTLPNGLTLTTGGILNGTPTMAGTFNFTVTATDANNNTGSRAYTITIAAPQPQTFVVDTASDDATLTACTTAPNDCSLRGAIANANAATPNDTITFAIPASDAGCANNVCTITLTSGQLTIDQASTAGTLAITNTNGTSGNLVISGNNASRVFAVNSNANLTLTNVTVTRGANGMGGGIINTGGTLTINNSTVSGNNGGSGGGINNVNGGTATINNSTISGNTTTNSGGGITNNGNSSTLTINNSIISGNTTSSGGGIRNTNSGTVNLNNSTISNNTASGSEGGGGISILNGTLNLTNATIAFNSSTSASATTAAGGIAVTGSATVNLTNSIIARNTTANSASSPDFRGAIVAASSFNLIGDGTEMTGITNGTNGNQVGTSAAPIDPLLAALADNGGATQTHALQTGSPAIDKGNGTGTDQRGLTRPYDNPAIANATNGNGADIGAFEVQAAQVFYESDVAPRPNGDGSILPDDVAQVRRFLNGTDTANQATTEFQRADSSPRETFGNGVIGTNDVIQARRYANGTDARQVAAGPTGTGPRPVAAEPTRNINLTSAAKLNFVDLMGQRLFGEGFSPEGISSALRVENASGSAGQNVTVNIRVDATGQEAEYGFTLNYDQTKLSNPVIGAGNAGASVRSCNTGVAGQINCSVGDFPNNNPNSSDPSIGEIGFGPDQILLTVQFTVTANAQPGTTPLTFSNVNTSSDTPLMGSPRFSNGTVTVAGPTAAAVTVAGRIFSAMGRGIANARVVVTDQNGFVRTARTNPLGYYRFNDIVSGQTYVFNVSHKSYQFTPRVVSVIESQGKFDFVANN